MSNTLYTTLLPGLQLQSFLASLLPRPQTISQVLTPNSELKHLPLEVLEPLGLGYHLLGVSSICDRVSLAVPIHAR
jgi:hypothetical protein